jgi:hypothetical protein
MDVLESLGVGQQVEVSYNVRGREFNGRYYNTLDAWKVEVIGPREQTVNIAPPLDIEQDDLPF